MKSLAAFRIHPVVLVTKEGKFNQGWSVALLLEFGLYFAFLFLIEYLQANLLKRCALVSVYVNSLCVILAILGINNGII